MAGMSARKLHIDAGEGTTALANRLKKKKTAEERAADAERRRQLQVIHFSESVLPLPWNMADCDSGH